MTTKTGPQKYPGASTSAWYGGKYQGSAMEVNVVVLHTTEGRSLPDYGGGALAPTLTAVPDFAARKLRWYQHFDIDTSARALVNASGGVETNTLNVCQLELVGTCDPATHAKWEKAGQAHIYWPQAPDWALAEVAVFLRWMNAEHGVPLSGPSKWPAYPSSYGSSAGARLSFSAWKSFAGICGHMHVPENVHGDPGAIDFNRLLTLAKGGSTPPAQEDDVALTDADKKWIADTVKAQSFTGVWKTDALGAPADASDVDTNKTWEAQSILRDIQARVRANTAAEAAQTAAITKLAQLVGSDVDTAQVVAAVQQAIKDAVVKVNVNVTGPGSP